METANQRRNTRELRQKYTGWKKLGFKGFGFFPVFNGFKHHHLTAISGGALKLYIYIGIHSRNDTGVFWHSEETIGAFFGVSTRTVRTWFKELCDRDLIERHQFTYNGPTFTYLKPYPHEELMTAPNRDNSQ